MKIYESKFLRIDFFKEDKLIEATWHSATSMMNSKEYKSEFLNYLDCAIKYNSEKVIADEHDLNFTVVPDLQEWVNQHIFAKIPPQNLAIVLSEDIIAQLAVKQLMDEPEGRSKFQTKFFSDKEEARKWILSL